MWLSQYDVIRFISMTSLCLTAAPDCRTSQSRGSYHVPFGLIPSRCCCSLILNPLWIETWQLCKLLPRYRGLMTPLGTVWRGSCAWCISLTMIMAFLTSSSSLSLCSHHHQAVIIAGYGVPDHHYSPATFVDKLSGRRHCFPVLFTLLDLSENRLSLFTV